MPDWARLALAALPLVRAWEAGDHHEPALDRLMFETDGRIGPVVMTR